MMGNTADLAMVQKSLTPSTKRVSHRGSLVKGVAIQGVLYQSILNAKLTGRKKLGRKMCTSNRDDRKLENTVKHSRFKHLVRASQGVNWSWSQCIKSHHAQKSSGKGLLKPKNHQKHLTWGLRRKRTGQLLSCPKSSFQIKVNFAFNLEIKVPESGGRVERHIIQVAYNKQYKLSSDELYLSHTQLYRV